MTTVAFVGLGQMGGHMSANLAKAGVALRTYDQNGKGTSKTLQEAVRGADVLITMLPDGKVVREVVAAALPALAKGSLVIDMSSSDPVGTVELGKVLRKKGIRLLDAPVSGAVVGARDATLAIMVGGDAKDLEDARPLFEKMGKNIFHTGKLGAGHATKALNNYIGAAGTIAAFEAVIVGRKFGLDPHTMVSVFNASTGYNSSTQRKLPQQVLTKAFASGFSAALMSKDVGIAASLAAAMRLPAPYLKATSRLWRDALEGLPRGADHTEMFRYLEKLKTPSRGAAARRSASRPRRRPAT